MQTGKRTCESADFIGNDIESEFAITREILVGIDQQAANLRHEPVQHPLHHWLFAKGLKAFVDTAHAPAFAAGQHDPANLRNFGQVSACIRIVR